MSSSPLSNRRSGTVRKAKRTMIETMAAKACGVSAIEAAKFAKRAEKSIGAGPMKNMSAANVPKKLLLNLIRPCPSTPTSCKLKICTSRHLNYNSKTNKKLI